MKCCMGVIEMARSIYMARSGQNFSILMIGAYRSVCDPFSNRHFFFDTPCKITERNRAQVDSVLSFEYTSKTVLKAPPASLDTGNYTCQRKSGPLLCFGYLFGPPLPLSEQLETSISS